jgi:exosortase/archaeosortase family protein
MVLFYAFWFSHFCQTILQPRFFSVNATLSSFILNLFGMGTVANRECISSSVFSVNIARGCDAVEAMALFASAMLAYPSKWNDKLIGFLASILVLFVLNISRVVSLFLTGIYFPKAFEFMHVEFWQVLFVIFAIGLLFIWIKWTEKEASHDSR